MVGVALGEHKAPMTQKDARQITGSSGRIPPIVATGQLIDERELMDLSEQRAEIEHAVP